MFEYMQNLLSKSLCKVIYRRFNSKKYTQGFYMENGVREYFYYIDHQGQLFLDGTKIRNFVTCFKDKAFLVFFYKRIKTNNGGKYSDDYPYISPCGLEMNYVRCESKPIVFTDIFEVQNQDFLAFNGLGDLITVPFQPSKLFMFPSTGRIYHPAAEKVGGVGILKTSLAVQLSSGFVFSECSNNFSPTHFIWKGKKILLDNSLSTMLRSQEVHPE
ncbi:UPF0598 protein CG30010 isoform X2 [Hydra vulgaris]|uniref:UPF0598 protein CG30010 isoform X2 n=1 Tax=Hydra vulgaris TaxID=6087 RepID=A0ABM4DKE4_HYDVU